MSNAFDMSRAMVTVLCGGCFWLKPCVMWCVSLCSAVSVECLALNPC